MTITCRTGGFLYLCLSSLISKVYFISEKGKLAGIIIGVIGGTALVQAAGIILAKAIQRSNPTIDHNELNTII